MATPHISAEAAAQLKALIDTLSAIPAPAPESQVVMLSAEADLQAALNAVPPGYTLHLEDGAVYTGNFTVGPKDAPGVVVRGKARLHSPNQQPALATRAGACNWTFEDLTFTAQLPDGSVVRLGTGSHAEADIPHHITFDNVQVLGGPSGGKRGIEANADHVTIVNSVITDFWRNGQDSQAICIWNAHGPLWVQGCLLEASGENFMSGGADPSVVGMVPSDITFIGNHCRKPLTWKGTNMGTIKNLFELKFGRRVVVRHNIFENNWLHGQSGFGILLKTTGGNSPWVETCDVTFEDNDVLNVSSGINLAGLPESKNGIRMSRITIRNNYIKTNRAEMGGQGWGIMLQGVNDVTIENNTIDQDGPVAIFLEGPVVNERLVIRRNILIDPVGGWGIKGASAVEGIASLNAWAPGHVLRDNLIVTTQPHLYGPAAQNRLEAVMPLDVSGYGADR